MTPVPRQDLSAGVPFAVVVVLTFLSNTTSWNSRFSSLVTATIRASTSSMSTFGASLHGSLNERSNTEDARRSVARRSSGPPPSLAPAPGGPCVMELESIRLHLKPIRRRGDKRARHPVPRFDPHDRTLIVLGSERLPTWAPG